MTKPVSVKGGMSARDVAAELGVAERTVRRWIESGDLTAKKRHGVFVIDLDAARAVYRQSRVGRSAERSTEIAELRGRYLEVCERLVEAESELEKMRRRAEFAERVLYPPREAVA